MRYVNELWLPMCPLFPVLQERRRLTDVLKSWSGLVPFIWTRMFNVVMTAVSAADGQTTTSCSALDSIANASRAVKASEAIEDSIVPDVCSLLLGSRLTNNQPQLLQKRDRARDWSTKPDHQRSTVLFLPQACSLTAITPSTSS